MGTAMTGQNYTSVDYPLFKVAIAWLAAIGISSWSDVAAMLAAFYSLLLIGEWFWKRTLRPCFERRGWVKRQYRRQADKLKQESQ